MLKCKNCGSEKLVKAGFTTTIQGKKQRYQCKGCGRTLYLITPKKPLGINCKSCGSERVVKAGYHITKEGKRQRCICQNCGTTFYFEE